jgi:CRISPR-associated protein Cmr1
METITFQCKTTTPLVMNGAYGNNDPELRPPGIKASLRFWWRALNGHLLLTQLKEQEAAIFGSTKGRSKVIIRVEENIDETLKRKYSLLPHKGGSEAEAFNPNQSFKIRIDFDEKVFSVDEMKNLFVLACTLGGWGKRSRRGFGAVTVVAINNQPYLPPTTIDGIKDILDRIVPNHFSMNISTGEILTNHNSTSSRGDYPEIWKIQIGKTVKSLEDIGQATHETKFNVDISPNKQDYSKSLGDGRPRLASPVYVSILENGFPVITTLKKESWVNVDLQDNLKSKIL